MLTFEQAQKQLEQFQIKNWEKQRLDALTELPDEVKVIGYLLLGRNSQGEIYSNWKKQNEAKEKAFKKLVQLSTANRKKLFAVFFPRLADYMEKAYQRFRELPYEVDFTRKGFRSPNDPEIAAAARYYWVQSMINSFKGYDPDLLWAAAWAPHVATGYNSQSLGVLFAVALDEGGPVAEELFTILKESATNEHPIGQMGRHIVISMLASSRPDAWEFIEKLLLAAQRQEGLRSVIFEAVDLTHPEAFKRMVRLILQENLLRFSSVVRAVDVWFGLQWSALTPAVLKQSLELVLKYLDDPAARAKALKNDKAESLYLALWAIGFEDAQQAIEPAKKLLEDRDVERRFVAVKFLADLQINEVQQLLVQCLEDEDLRIAVTAAEAITKAQEQPKFDPWNQLIHLLERLPEKPKESEPLVWPWVRVTLSRNRIADQLINYLGKRPATDLIPYIHEMNSFCKGELIDALTREKNWDSATRDLLFDLAGDRDSWVRDKALQALTRTSITEVEARRIETLLTRKTSEVRQGVLHLLSKQPEPQLLASIDRLLASKKILQRLAALELMRQQIEKKKYVEECRSRAVAYRANLKQIDEEEQLHLEAILDLKRETPTLENCLGLIDPATRSKTVAPKARKVKFASTAANECLKELEELIKKHALTPIQIEGYDGQDEILLANADWRFPNPGPGTSALAEAQKRLPLFDVWEDWYHNRGKKLKDSDGLELIRALVWFSSAELVKQLKSTHSKYWSKLLNLMLADYTPIQLEHLQILHSLLLWLLKLHPPAGTIDYLLDAIETGYAHVSEEVLKRVVDHNNWQKRSQDWRIQSPIDRWLIVLHDVRQLHPQLMTEDQFKRLWNLQHWRDEPVPGVTRVRPDLELLVEAYRLGLANQADVIDQLIGPPENRSFQDLYELTQADCRYLKRCPQLQPLVEKVKNRILEIELQRGELPTAASKPAKKIASISGLSQLLHLLTALGGKPPSRSRYGEGRIDVLTHLIQVSHPTIEDTPECFAEEMKKAKISRERLLELAFLAPAWLEHIEHTLGWPGLREGVWWYLAHMPRAWPGVGSSSDTEENFVEFDLVLDEDTAISSGESNQVNEPSSKSSWEKLLAERTPFSLDEMRAGAVDSVWFHRVFPRLGRKRWEALAEAAKFGCDGVAHKKAIRLTEVLLGRAKRAELIAGIKKKNLKENVRLLGLLPLPEGKRRENELLTRYKVLIDYRRYARGLGPMSREQAERTATIGLTNLAKTAGYNDPIRLEWAMEAKQTGDLAQGPVAVTVNGVTVSLAINSEAQPEISIHRGEKLLKTLPAPLRKNKKVVALLERRADLKRQASRVKQTLESMMVRGDTFTGSELRQLCLHALLKPAIERLVILGEGICGYPIAGGQALENHEGKREPVKSNEQLRLAHPYDLFSAGDWAAWQSHCFRTERVQPFKQVFRELYIITAQEKVDGTASSRYAGQQVNPRQAMALFGSRGWATREAISKTFHEAGIVAEVWFRHHGWTGAEVEGLTLDTIRFRRVNEAKSMPLTEVPPRLFSEVMRDCDLVVSVAHVGGVDPEASASTVQMREALIRETCALLNINNFDIVKQQVRIQGKLGNYSVHLGSGVVHRQPGGHVCIVPVHSQHRGRLFLPFADDDPRTAEVVSKVLLLTRDHEIQDPSILEQLRS